MFTRQGKGVVTVTRPHGEPTTVCPLFDFPPSPAPPTSHPPHPLHFSLTTAVVFHKGFTDSAQLRSADPDFKNKNPGDLQPGYSDVYEETKKKHVYQPDADILTSCTLYKASDTVISTEVIG